MITGKLKIRLANKHRKFSSCSHKSKKTKIQHAVQNEQVKSAVFSRCKHCSSALCSKTKLHSFFMRCSDIDEKKTSNCNGKGTVTICS